jgi:hypothetical protein
MRKSRRIRKPRSPYYPSQDGGQQFLVLDAARRLGPR